MKHVHVIPIAPGRTVADTWMELCVMGILDPPAPEPCQWVPVECDGEECKSIRRKEKV